MMEKTLVWKLINITWLLFFCCNIHVASSLNVLEAIYKTEIIVTMDDDIYLQRRYPPCLNYDIPEFNEEKCIYIKDKANCVNPSDKCLYNKILCDDSIMIDLTNDKYSENITLFMGEIKYYTFNYKEDDKYNFYYIEVIPNYGDPNMEIITSANFVKNGYKSAHGGFYGADQSTLCPNQEVARNKVEPGTVLIKLTTFNSLSTATGNPGSSFTLNIIREKMPVKKNTESCNLDEITDLPQNDPVTKDAIEWKCLVDGKGIEFNGVPKDNVKDYFFVYYKKEASECQNVLWEFVGESIYMSFDDVPLPGDGYNEMNKNLLSFIGNPKGDFLNICPNKNKELRLYIRISPYVNYDGDAETSYLTMGSILIDSSGDWRYTKRIVDYGPYQAAWEMQMSAQLICSKDGEVEKRQCNFRLSLNEPAGCERMWWYYPTDIPNPFFPMPPWMYDVPEMNYYYPYNVPTSGNPRKFMFSIMMSVKTRDGPRSVIMEPDIMDSCFLVFMGSVVDKNGEPFPSVPIPLSDNFDFCDYKQYSISKDIIVGYIKEMRNKSGNDIRNLRISIDSEASTDRYSICSKMGTYIADLDYNLQSVITSHCTGIDTSPDDPCCNKVISWTGDNCVDRKTFINKPVYKSLNAIGDALTTKENRQCVDSYTGDFITGLSYQSSYVDGCDSNIGELVGYMKKKSESFRKCRDLIYGLNVTTGHLCDSDADCTLIEGTECNLFRRTCNYPIKDLEKEYYKCFLKGADISLFNSQLSKIYNTNLLPITEPTDDEINTIVEQLQNSASVEDCTGEYTYGLPYRARVATSLNSPDNNEYCFHGMNSGGMQWPCINKTYSDLYYTAGFQCNRQKSGNMKCDQKLLYLPTTMEVKDGVKSCPQSSECNWVQKYNEDGTYTAIEPSECGNTEFCGLCDGEENPCLYLGEKDACKNDVGACRLNNGEFMLASKSDCESNFKCSVKCDDNTECPDESSCKNAGFCSDRKYFNGKKICLGPIRPYWNSCEPVGNTGDYGLITERGCLYYALDENKCTELGFQFVGEINNENACNAVMGCLEPYYLQDTLNPYIYTLKPKDICEKYGFKYVNFLDWKGGTWKSGTFKKSEVITKKMRDKVKPVKTVSLYDLGNNIDSSSIILYSYFVKSEATCDYLARSSAFLPIACACLNYDKNDACFPKVCNFLAPDNSIGVLSFYPGTKFVFFSPPFSFSVETDSISQRVEDDIQTFYVFDVSSSVFQSRVPKSIGTFLIDFNIDRSYELRNNKTGYYGQVVGDGVVLTNLKTNSLFNVTICFTLRGSISIQSRYKHPDIGIIRKYDTSSDKNRVDPLYLDTFFDGLNHMCGRINVVDKESVYIPIYRIKKVKDALRVDLPAGQVVFFTLICAIYWITACAVFQRVLSILVNGLWTVDNTQFWIFLCINAMLGIRGLYLLLILFGPAIDNDSSSFDYVFIELPMFLFFTIISFFFMTWANLIRIRKSLNKRNDRRNFWILFFIVNGILYLSFIILIIIYEGVKPKPVVSCGGRFVTIDQSTKQIISIIYRIIVGLFALIISIGFLATGMHLYFQIIGIKRSLKAKRRLKIFWLTIICSFSLIMLSLLLLTLAITSYKNNYLSLSILAFLEVGPCAVILSVLWRTERDGTNTMSATSRA